MHRNIVKTNVPTVPTKVVKENAEIFPDFIHPATAYRSINKNQFWSFLKLADLILVFIRKAQKTQNTITGQ